jgi:hypothetical protein
MKPYKKITISFLPSDSDLWEFIEQKKEKQNLSEYIRSLIRKDRDDFSDTKNMDIEKVLQFLTSQRLTTFEEKTTEVKNPMVTVEVRNAIDSLF